MTQEQFNILIRAIVFASSTDSCMDTDACEGILDSLKALLTDNPDLVDGITFGSLYIYGDNSDLWEDREMNKDLLELFDGKLKTHE